MGRTCDRGVLVKVYVRRDHDYGTSGKDSGPTDGSRKVLSGIPVIGCRYGT